VKDARHFAAFCRKLVTIPNGAENPPLPVFEQVMAASKHFLCFMPSFTASLLLPLRVPKDVIHG
jgi:hypothetical protein